MSDDSLHELLPWFLTGTLEADEAEAFRRHLEGCAECREEMEVLSKIREAAEREGLAYLSAHPEAEQLVALVEGELEGSEARDLRAHIALCSTCALESRWVAGDLIAGNAPEPHSAAPATPAGPARDRWARRRVLVAAAASIVLVAVAFSIFGPRERGPEIPRPFYLTGLERAAGDQVLQHDCSRSLLLILPVNLPPTAFPVSVEIFDDRGEAVLREDVSRDLLLEGLYLPVIFPAEACRPGDFRVQISLAGGEAPSETVFRIERP